VREIHVPIEVWYGENDVLVPAAHGRWLADHIPRADVHVERNNGHLPDPDIEVERLRTFVTTALDAG
jgi:pimeloyl-ACP methyl ester carboxylesterase